MSQDKTTPLHDSMGETSEEDLSGRVIDERYELVRLVGRGGMGAVYEARHGTTLKRCALKLLSSPDLVSHPALVKRFFREAKAGAAVESDHIVQVFDSGTDAATGWPFIAMELLNGEDVSDTIARLGAIEPRAAGKIALQAATGLSRAHELSIFHRDIKPANLFITRRDAGDCVVKILDFGIAKVLENFSDTNAALTHTGNMLGTPLYMSPEQARGAGKIDARSDVWSLGMVLYELLSGALPYEGVTSLAELMVEILTAEIAPLQDRAPWVPAELAEITQRAISRNLEHRYADAGALRDALAAALGGDRLDPSEIVSVTTEQRGSVAPRLKSTAQGVAHTADVTGAEDSPKPRAKWPIVVLGVTGISAVVATAVIATSHPKAPALPPAPVASEAPASATVTPSVVEPAPKSQSYFLPVEPAGAQVKVDGKLLSVTDGGIELSGAVGDTREVDLSLGDRHKNVRVALTREGLLPDRLMLDDTRAKPTAPAARPASTPPPKLPDQKRPEPKAKPAIKKKPELSTSTSEFDG
ncbi:MAG: serine/threonine protein kinase [Myxococcales bacterium]|nr:serine/threonine protein kinase [Myxococcales bacterium]MCB9578121.1 serine/threonine protein kinase [Polyangiaceae bacterium]